jgi:hypothetical protein
MLMELTLRQFFQSALGRFSGFEGLMSYLRRASMRMRLKRGRHSAVASSFKTKRNRSQRDVVFCIGYELAPLLVSFDINSQNIFLVCGAIRVDKKSKSWRF